MRINADFSRPAVVTPAGAAYVPSPLAGVERLMLDRIGGEVARATSIVRYAPRSRFSRHEHELGEEFIVLDGVFSDESGDYPRGSYVRNPPGTSHAPHSEPGCRIFVKLRQFDPGDRTPVAINFLDESEWEPGSDVLELHAYGAERVRVRRLAAGAALEIDPADAGTELLVIEGSLADGKTAYARETWLRYPPGSRVALIADEASLVWVKTGHLDPLPG